MRTLNISTGLARMALAAPAIEPGPIVGIHVQSSTNMVYVPANAISARESCGNGEIIRLEIPYDAKSREFTPAIPSNGLAIPVQSIHNSRMDMV